jgi:DNA-binding MarR family transcriptional regulator
MAGLSGTTHPRAETEPDDELRGRLVQETASLARGYLRWIDAAGCDGLSYPRLRALEELHCRGPFMMRALADQLGLTARNMTAVVDALESEGLAVRRSHPTDRRATVVELTAAGVEATEEAFEPRLQAVGELFDDVPPAEQRRFLATVETLLEGLRERGQRA